MLIRAQDVVQDAYERMNRLSPGETLSADDLAFGFRRLNILADELAAQQLFLFQDLLTSNAQSGNITLGTAPWAAIAPGSQVISVKANNLPLSPITVAQFNAIYQPLSQGQPQVWAQDGLSIVYLWPVPNGQTVQLQTRVGVAQFADYTTQYSVPDGYKAMLGASTAVRCAPTILGKIPPSLLTAEKRCMEAVDRYEPAIVDAEDFTGRGLGYWPPRLFS